MATLTTLNFDNSFARLPSILFTALNPTAIKSPFLVHFNPQLLDLDTPSAEELSHYFGGHGALPNSTALAMTYMAINSANTIHN